MDQITEKFPTLERLALNKVRQRYPRLQRRGFSGAVRAACEGELLKRIPIIPDGWFVDSDYDFGGPEHGELSTCVEIEDKHPLSPEKLWRYCETREVLDCCGHDLRLLVFDRYGYNERELGPVFS